MMKQIWFLFLVAFMSSCGFKQSKVDTILHNAQVETGVDGNMRQQAIAIKNGKIEAVGPEREILNQYQADEVLDMQQAIVYPGFIDAHSHFFGLAQNMLAAQLWGSASQNELLEKLKDFAGKNPDLPWITGRGWDQSLWEGSEWPTKALVDVAFPDKPLFITRVDGHSALVNTKAFEILKASPEFTKKAVIVEYNEQGDFTGVIKEYALDILENAMPKPSNEKMLEVLQRAERKLFAAGLTMVTDAGLPKEKIELLNGFYNANALKIPLYIMANPDDETLDWLASNPVFNENIHCYSVKVYGDGSLGSRSACLKKPYADQHNHFGHMTISEERLNELAQKCITNNWQLNTHCIGDSAVGFVLKTYANHLNGVNDRRWRIEHAQVVAPSDLKYFTENTIIPSVQPTHATSDMRWAEDRLNSERVNTAYAYQTLRNAMGIVAFGTDFPVEDISPLKTFYAAVFRKAPFSNNPENGFLNEEALSAEEALKGMTSWAALACRTDSLNGTIEAGKHANFTVLNADLLSLKSAEMKNVEVRSVFLKGVKVF